MLMTDEEAEWLRAKLIGWVGRIITVEEIREAMDLKPSTYYAQVREGNLLTYQNVVKAARAFGLNEVFLLVECGLLDRDMLEQYFDERYIHDHPSRRGMKVRGPTGLSKVRRTLGGSPNMS